MPLSKLERMETFSTAQGYFDRAETKLFKLCSHDIIFRLTVALSCPMDHSDFPMDEQICKISMESCKFNFIAVFLEF